MSNVTSQCAEIVPGITLQPYWISVLSSLTLTTVLYVVNVVRVYACCKPCHKEITVTAAPRSTRATSPTRNTLHSTSVSRMFRFLEDQSHPALVLVKDVDPFILTAKTCVQLAFFVFIVATLHSSETSWQRYQEMCIRLTNSGILPLAGDSFLFMFLFLRSKSNAMYVASIATGFNVLLACLLFPVIMPAFIFVWLPMLEVIALSGIAWLIDSCVFRLFCFRQSVQDAQAMTTMDTVDGDARTQADEEVGKHTVPKSTALWFRAFAFKLIFNIYITVIFQQLGNYSVLFLNGTSYRDVFVKEYNMRNTQCWMSSLLSEVKTKAATASLFL